MSKTIFYNQDQGFDFCFEDDQNQKSLCEICGCEIKKKRYALNVSKLLLRNIRESVGFVN